MEMMINADLIVIILVVLLFLCYFITITAYKIGFNDGLKKGKVIGKSDVMSGVEEDGNDN